MQGGGAKGAFQYGVLRELHSAGFDFDVISGTSVGALNGALVATESWDQGDFLWTHLSMERAFRWRKLQALYTALSLWGIIFFGWATNQFEERISDSINILFSIIAFLPSLFFSAWISFNILASSSSTVDWLQAICLFVLVGGCSFYGIHKRQWWFRPAVCISWATLLAIWSGWAVFHVAALSQFVRAMPLQSIGFAIISLSPGLVIVGYIHQVFNASFLANSPLRIVVSTILERPFCKPLIATTSLLVPEYVDPDNFDYMRFPRGTDWFAAQRSGFLATYNRIDKLSSSEAVDTLLASAALPMGVIPNVRGTKKGSRVVDGGLADNVPWHPLISDYPCTELLIILCEPDKPTHKPSIEAWQKRERLMRVMKSGYQPAKFTGKRSWSAPPRITVHNEPPTEVPMPKPGESVDFEKLKVTVIGSQKPLGGGKPFGDLIATMNFSASKALNNIELGRIAARGAIDAGLSPK